MPPQAKQAKLIRELYEFDHAFLPKNEALRFSRAFGFDVHTHVERANPDDFKGLSLPNGMTEMDGIAAHSLALQIASHIGVTVPDMYGVGSQLRIACSKVLEHLNGK